MISSSKVLKIAQKLRIEMPKNVNKIALVNSKKVDSKFLKFYTVTLRHTEVHRENKT